VFATISAAMAASHDGDTIQIQAGTYTNDTAKITTSITLQATGGRVLMRETVPLANQKGILIVGTQTAAATVRIDGFEFAGASTPYGNNGAGIRYQNGNPTLTNDYFHNNQAGILATPWQPGTGTLLIDHSEFAYNGTGRRIHAQHLRGRYRLIDAVEQLIRTTRLRDTRSSRPRTPRSPTTGSSTMAVPPPTRSICRTEAMPRF
jgi:hypothetical protein